MHQVFLGCAKSVIVALVGSIAKRDYSAAEERLSNMKSPREACAISKPLAELAFWKGKEFKFFLFPYSSFCLQGAVRPDLHLSSAKLSISIRLLSMRNPCETDIRDAEIFQREFLSDFLEVYLKDSQSFNFHALRLNILT